MRFCLLFILCFFSCSKLFKKKKEIKREDYTLRTKAYQFGPTQASSSSDFIDKTTEYGLEKVHAKHFYAIDFSLDGYSDLVMLTDRYSSPQFWQYFPQERKFRQVKSRFQNSVIASYLLFYDFDKDGILDAISGVLNQKSELTKIPLKYFKGEIERGMVSFKEVKDAISLEASASATVAVLDYNNDGYLDLFVGNWFGTFEGKPVPEPDKLLKGDGKKFVDVSHLLEGENEKLEKGIMYINARPTYGGATCDIDQNGFADILTTSTSRYQNKLWMNLYTLKDDNRVFKDYGLQSYYSSDVEGRIDPRGGGRSFFSACTDYNNDGMMDIYLGELTHSYDHSFIDKSSVLTGAFKNFPPEFIRTEYMNDIATINWNQGDRRAVWFDYNFDGLIDLLVDNSGFPPTSRLVLFKQNPDHSFENIAHLAGIDLINPTGSIVLDLNKDGKLDIITSQISQRNSDIEKRIYVFENQIPYEGRRSLRVYLKGESANSQGIGSLIRLKTKIEQKQRIQTRWVEFSQGALPSQHEEGILFGLDRGEVLLDLEVSWPAMKSEKKEENKNLRRHYSLESYKFKYHLEMSVCDSGRHFQGNKPCD